MRMKVAILLVLAAAFAYQVLPTPSSWPGPSEVETQVAEWTLKPEQRTWEAVRWTEDPALAFQEARRTDRLVLVFRSAAPFSRG